MEIKVGEKRAPYSIEQAKQMLHWYIVGTSSARLQRRNMKSLQIPEEPFYFNGASRFYDPLRSPDGFLHPVQITGANGLNARISATERATAAGLADAVNAHLREISATHLLDVDLVEGAPKEGSDQCPMERAFDTLQLIDGVGYTKASKILHLARPSVFPVLDRKTAPHLTDWNWVCIQRQLDTQREQFRSLVEFVAELTDNDQDLVPLGDLRIHDILLWCDVTGKRAWL